MSFNFPDAPTVGQIYEPVLGVSYVWTPPVWRRQVSPSETMGDAPVDGLTYGRKNEAWSPVVGGALISDIPPAPPLQAGQLWYEGDSGATYIYYDDGNSVQWVQIAGPQSGQQNSYVRNDTPQTMAGPLTITSGPVTVAGQVLGPTAQTRNRIVNPCMQIQQDATMAGGFLVDQWQAGSVIAGSSYGRVAGPTTLGSKYMLQFHCGTAKPSLAAADWIGWLQPLEGVRVADFMYGTAAAKQSVLRLCMYSTVAGTFSIALNNGAYNRCYVDTFVVTPAQVNTYAYYTFVIPGDVTGTWPTDTSKSLEVSVTAASGSTWVTATKGWQAGNKYAHSSASNGAATVGDFYISDVGLYLDPQNTGIAPRWEMPDEAAELQACQRYWENGIATTNVNLYMMYYFKVNKRIIPAASIAPVTTTINVYISHITVSHSATVGVSWIANARM